MAGYGYRMRSWAPPVVAITVAALFLLGAVGAAGVLIVEPAAAPASPEATATTLATVAPATNTSRSWIVDPPSPVGVFCALLPVWEVEAFGPGCGYTTVQQWKTWAGQTELASLANLLILAGNSFNETAAEVANLNATEQELLSYYEGRAEAIVPYFLNSTWNATTEDQVAIDSGLVPAIEGLEFAYAWQEFENWNSTINSWNNLFGATGTYAHTGSPALTGLNENLSLVHQGGSSPHCTTPTCTKPGAGLPLTEDGNSYDVSQPWEVWNATVTTKTHPLYFNLMGGGTIVCANSTGPPFLNAPCPTIVVDDLTKNTSFTVPQVTLSSIAQANVEPIVTSLHSVSPFDLLKLYCSATCTGVVSDVEVVGGYAFQDYVKENPCKMVTCDQTKSGKVTLDYIGVPPIETPRPLENTMVYHDVIGSVSGSMVTAAQWVPNLDFTLCGIISGGFVGANCQTGPVTLTGIDKPLGSGPSGVPGGNDSVTHYQMTSQSLINNTLNDSEVYYDTLRAITDHGKYTIPPDCSIPGPSTGFPTSVNPADYKLGLDEGLVAYWSYLNSVGKAYDNATTWGLEFCGNPHLAMKFNWTGSWNLSLKITASIYLGTAHGIPTYLNGTPDPNETYANPDTWPIKNVTPTLLFPYEYLTSIPTLTVWPVPANDPIAGILVNFTKNDYYGSASFKPAWGIPTFLHLGGEGNYIWPNGTISHISGGTPTKGDAVYISSCYVAGVPTNPCNIAVNYFSSFTYGHQNGLVGPPQPPGGVPPIGGVIGTGLLGSGSCGTGGLNQWYDSWGAGIVLGFGDIFTGAGNIPIVGPFLVDLGCLIGWIIFIAIILVLLYAIYRIGSGTLSRRRSSSGGGGSVLGTRSRQPTTINVNIRGSRKGRS